jgi:hypothetical protein
MKSIPLSKPERTFVEKITTIAGVIAALGGVLAAATQFSDQVKDLLGKLAELPPAAWWVIAGLLLSLGIFGLMHGLARRSRLLRPEALRLDSHKVEHLKGREEDIDRLLMLCREYLLVHLVGESGAGKSALLQAGLCPKLRQDSAGLLPIYIEVWGQDWEAGPHSALTEAFWQVLSEPDRQALNLKALDHPDDLFATLERCRPSLRRTPLLISINLTIIKPAIAHGFFPVASAPILAPRSSWPPMSSGARSRRCLTTTPFIACS